MVQSVHGVRLVQPALPSQRDNDNRQDPGRDHASASRQKRAIPVSEMRIATASTVTAAYTAQLIASNMRLMHTPASTRNTDALRAYHAMRRYGSAEAGSVMSSAIAEL
ncbi:hypothetical protein [Coralliovum pocilloporae]|uniref:hypothetical protein n=1 Tax=Coralliovum pocilloporae TaxID=3066369 RepID=UPI003307C1D0